MACFQHVHDYTLLAETPEMHAKKSVVCFIEQEVKRPSKQWIANIIDGTQEKDDVIVRSDEFILLPDTERVNRYRTNPRPFRQILNWLAIAQDKGIRTLRDLTGQHVPMLKRMLSASLEAAERETGIRQDRIMAYVHYPPSVYQLHVHIAYPYGQFGHRDAYRIHNLASVINNLEIDPQYYQKATLHMAILRNSQHLAALLDEFSHLCDQRAVKSFPSSLRASDLLQHDTRQNWASLHKTCFLVLAAGDTAQTVCVANAKDQKRQSFLYLGSSYSRITHGATPSELDENYVPLHFHGTMAVFDKAGRFHAIVPIESGITLFPRQIRETDVPRLARWVESCMARSIHASIWVTDAGDSYNEHTLECSPRLKSRV